MWAHSQATGSALLALLAIADHDGDGGAWPSMDTIAHRARVSREAARKLVRRLEDLGEIETETNGGGGLRTAAHMRTNRYEITLECPPNCDRSFRHRERAEPVDNTPPPNGGVPSARRGTPPPNGGANHPINTPTNNSASRSGVMGANDRDSDSKKDPYADLSQGEKQEQARKRMISDRTAPRAPSRYSAPPAPRVPRYDPAQQPPTPKPRSAEADAAVAAFLAIPADHKHMIPATSTVCLKCATDALTTTERNTP